MAYKKGESGNPAGRPVGCKNKYTLIKELVMKTLIDRKDELKELPLNKVLQFVASTSPKETKVEIDTPIVIKWADK